ncbi:PD-(D/E)XK nuclease family protein [Actinomyces provencensis]|uniref:PD-(D/E)XK nuclease family protein n=1 Tax=Actinomyces provencensis TaxID=1720198 RepID=UPI00096AA75F|nr:PD-(D/E)XK nuclease family protein [Actinomyces provencensis]
MHVTFGWGFDGARWGTGAPGPTSFLAEVTLGPAGLVDLLSTRLACGGVLAEQPMRIAAYRRALADLVQGSTPELSRWYARGFEVDPWRTARELLAWRDELVSAGWLPAPSPASDRAPIPVHVPVPEGPTAGTPTPVTPTTPHRLATLAAVETLLAGDPTWGPGPADLLREVAGTLADLASSHTRWPTGIERIDVDHRINLLPPIWRWMLQHLEDLGVEVHELPEPAPLEQLTILTADTVWDAAPVAARVLSQWHRDDTPHTVLATLPSDQLDRELRRRHLPTLGVAEQSAQRPVAQVIRVFLEAVSAPHDIAALADLLTTSLTVSVPDLPADSTPRPVRLLPLPVCSALLDALAEQPGVGGPAWTSAIDRFQDTDPAQTPSARLAREFDDLLRVHPIRPRTAHIPAALTTAALTPPAPTPTPGHALWPVAEILDHLNWLRARLSVLGRTHHASALVDAAHRAKLAAQILADLGESVSRRELDAVIDECVDATPLPAALCTPAADPLRDVAQTPAQLALGTAGVLWWGPVDPTGSPRQRTRSAERTHLAGLGITLPDRQALAALDLDSALRGLRRRRRVIAVLPTRLAGRDTTVHPALTFLVNDLRGSDPTATLSDIRSAATVPPSAAHRTDPPAWIVPGLASAALRRPAHRDLPRPDPVHRRVAPGDQLLPTRLSFTQLERLLIHPLDWLLRHPLLIRPSGLAAVPTGAPMLGTWMHAGVQTVVRGALERSGGQPVLVATGQDGSEGGASAVRAVLEALVPVLASELDLPGRSRERAALLDQGSRAIAGLFEALGSAGVRVVGSEVAFPDDVVLPSTRADAGAGLLVRGARDLDVLLPDGRRGVVDLKFSRSKRKYHDLVAAGQALQLAVYAHAVAQEVAGEHPGAGAGAAPAPTSALRPALRDVPVGYWSLRLGRMDSSFPELAGDAAIEVTPAGTGGADADDLMRRAMAGLGDTLERLQAGEILDLGNALAVLDREVGPKVRRALEKRDPLADVVPPDLISGPGALLTSEDLRLLERSWRTTFLPVGSAGYADFARITGIQEEQL